MQPGDAEVACGRTDCAGEPVVQWQRIHPDAPGSTAAVYACVGHAISADAAALIHEAGCLGPNSANLPECGCTPSPPPAPPERPPGPPLPGGW